MSMIVIMGSGETAPTMTRTHRRVLERTMAGSGDPAAPGGPAGVAAMLDTTFGFQANADELVTRTRGYFAESVGREVEAATWRRADDDLVTRERSLALLARARWAFAGPGSPTYALRQWRDTPVPAALVDVVARGGTVVVGSAAACTVGVLTVPVYEIYKAGADLYWDDGLDLLGRLGGLRAAVVPHFDNHEGGTYDTRFCYLGARRLHRMEAMLPAGVGVLGVDEHTAVLLDLAAGVAEVTGNGVLTVRGGGRATEFEAGSRVPLADVASLLAGEDGGGRLGSATPGGRATAATVGGPADAGEADDREDDAEADPRRDGDPAETSLRAAADACRRDFDAARAARDAGGCTGAVLSLEQLVHDWSADTLDSDDLPHARRVLRAMVVELGHLAEVGAADPREAIEPFVSALLELRARARGARDYATADTVRDALTGAGVEVRDTPDGVVWELR